MATLTQELCGITAGRKYGGMGNAQDNRGDGRKKEMENSHHRRRIKTVQVISQRKRKTDCNREVLDRSECRTREA